MKILITGGAGYLGTTLVPLLLKRGDEVIVFDLLRFGIQPLIPFCCNPRFSLVRGDIRDRRSIETPARKADAVVHLAAIVGHPACAAAPQEAQTVNVDGTRNLAAVLGRGRPVVFASTSSCYGSVPEGTCDEDTPLRPVSLYGTTKARCETILLDSCDAVVCRIATAYGLSPRLRLDLLINNFVHRALHEHRIALYQPAARRSFLHVHDAARAVVMALEQPGSMIGRAFNVGHESQNMTKMDVCRAIREIIPGVEIDDSATAEDPDHRDYVVSYARMGALGFSPTHTIPEGIHELVRALRWIGCRDAFGNMAVEPA
ncbi:MAG TPA: NAD(P)-dependent oxidoreductase [Phycisphaerae bacterium]|nr:NAD(P)-dependent oxidoreductase [Phycisphaerae bacterium]